MFLLQCIDFRGFLGFFTIFFQEPKIILESFIQVIIIDSNAKENCDKGFTD
jgi:hypothetical protein